MSFFSSAIAAICACGLSWPPADRHQRRGALERLRSPRRARRPCAARGRAPSAPGSCRGFASAQRPKRRRSASAADRRRPSGVASARRSAPNGCSTHLIEADLQLVEVGVERRLQRRVGVEPLRVRAHQLAQPGVAEGVDDVLDEQRRLEVRERDRLRILNAAFRSRSFSVSPRFSIAGELDVHLAAPLGARLLLLVDRDAFGQPARQPLVRHLQRDDVRQLVPERRFPLELARRPRPRRIHRDDAAEAGAERADHAGQADVADREVVVLREDLDEDRALRRELVARRQRAERLLRQRHRVLLQHRRLVLVQPHHDVAVAHGDELVERVHHLQQVVGDVLNGSALNDGSSAARAAGSSPVRSRWTPRSPSVRGLLGVERQRAPRQRRPPRRTGSCARPARRRRGRPRRSSARWRASSPPRPRTPAACPRRRRSRRAARAPRGSTG